MAVTDPVMPNTAPLGPGWLGDRRFDLALILGIPALGLRSEAAPRSNRDIQRSVPEIR